MSADTVGVELRLTIQAIASPQQVFHVLGHDSRDVLQFRIHLVKVGPSGRLCSVCECGRLCCPGVFVEPRSLGDECVCGG